MKSWLSALALLLAVSLPVLAFGADTLLTNEAAVVQVLDLMDQRLGLMPAVAATKWQTHAPIAAPDRERVVIKHAGELAAPLGLAADRVEPVFEIQVRLARELEESLTERWQAKGFQYEGPVPDLVTQLRPQIDTVTTRLMRGLYLAAPVFQAPDFIKDYSGLASAHLHSVGWSDASRKELLAALAGVTRTPMEDLKRVSASGVLRVGVAGDYAPFAVDHDGVVSGADVELAKLLAARLKVEPVFVRTSWGSLLSDLRAGDFDIAMGGVSITPERQAAGAFSQPYATGGKTLITRCRDAARYHDLAAVDQAKVRVVVNPGGTNEQFVRANLHKAEIHLIPDNRAIFDEIVLNRADVMITDDAEVELQTHRHPELCRPYAGTFTRSDKAVLLPKNSGLLSAVNLWLADALAAGTPAKLLSSYSR
ncbi:MAG TPA: transporter substrate-binding domain-containing protein [Steroidobacteraceae bacterium]|jgi:cyclohexadienyl dehydratase